MSDKEKLDLAMAALALIQKELEAIIPALEGATAEMDAAVADEREACAKIAEHYADESGYAFEIAREIRERGNPALVESDESYQASEALQKFHHRRETEEHTCPPTNPPS